MPTGYTGDLYEGKSVTFQEFAQKCARAFGALIEMRDDSLNTPIPDEFKPSEHHLKAIETTKKRLAEVKKWDFGQAEKEAKKAFNKEAQSEIKHRASKVRIGKSYVSMLKQVAKWVPPTKDHEGLKAFMVEQLAQSIDFDCLHEPTMPKRLSGKQFHIQLMKKLRRDIAYHTKMHKEEVLRVHGRNEWVRALRRSL